MYIYTAVQPGILGPTRKYEVRAQLLHPFN